MIRLLKKEFALCLHPAAVLFLGLSTMMLIPNYPLSVSFFYVTLGIFFICMSGRENHDVAFTLSLPVSRRQLVAGRMLMACSLELAQLVLCAGMVLLRIRLLGTARNEAGMDANLALFGEGFVLFGLFNLIFFPAWYKDVRKVGVPFLKASAAVFFWIVASLISTFALPFVRDMLDTPDPAFLKEKILYLMSGAVFFLGATWLAFHRSAKRFARQDLSLD